MDNKHITLTLPKEGLQLFQTESGFTLVDVNGVEYFFMYQNNGSLDYDGSCVTIK